MREKVKLLSTAGTGHFYVATKNKRLHPDKMNVKKYDPVVRKHVDYKESKIKWRSLRRSQSGAQSVDHEKRPRQSPDGALFLCLLNTQQAAVRTWGGGGIVKALG